MNGEPDRVKVFCRERSHLLAMAFRILGSDADAQDAVQESWIRFARANVSEIANVPAWLSTVVTRICLDQLRRSREYPRQQADLDPAAAEGDPEQVTLLAGELTEAVSVVLNQLTPPQRVALVLHDVFGTPFDEIAHVLGTSTLSARKLASRARTRIREAAVAGAVRVDEGGQAHEVVAAFLKATREGDIDGLIELLDPQVVRTSDPQVLPPGAAQRLCGARAVAAVCLEFRASARRARLVTVDGRPGLAVWTSGGLRVAMAFRIAAGRIAEFDVIADPQRLSLLSLREEPC